MTTQESVKHNHITRDIKPLGQCPACDNYHNRHIPNAVKFFKPDDFKTLFFADQSCPTDAAELANKKISGLIDFLYELNEFTSSHLEDMEYYFDNKCCPTKDEVNQVAIADSQLRLFLGKLKS